MRRFFMLVGALALVLSVGAGCKKDGGEAAPKAGEAAPKAEEAAKKADEAVKQADEAVKQAGEAGEKAMEQAKAAAAAAEAATAEVQPQPTPADSPAAAVPSALPGAPPMPGAAADLPIEEAKLDKLVEYSEEMAKILEANAADPGEAAKKLEAYLQTNKEEREALLNEFEGMKEKLTPEQQTALGMKLLSKLGPLMQRMQKLFQEHPNLATDPRIQEAMTPFKK